MAVSPFVGKQDRQSVSMTSAGFPTTKPQEVKDLPANSTTTGITSSSSFLVHEAGPGPSLHHQRKKNRSHGSSRRAVKKSQPSSVCFQKEDGREDLATSTKAVGEETVDSTATVSALNSQDHHLKKQAPARAVPNGRSHVQSRSIQKPRVISTHHHQQQRRQQYVGPKVARQGTTTHVRSRTARQCSADEQQRQLLKRRKTASKAWKASRFGSSKSTLSFTCHRIQGHPWTWVLES